MALDWVLSALQEKLGFRPYPGTLNLRAESEQDKSLWREVQATTEAIALPPPSPSFCAARLYPVEIETAGEPRRGRFHAAIVVPGVEGYPEDKMEIVAPVEVKKALGVQDGDYLTLEFGAV
jgi:CTP-dependent riboflavin kinase